MDEAQTPTAAAAAAAPAAATKLSPSAFIVRLRYGRTTQSRPKCYQCSPLSKLGKYSNKNLECRDVIIVSWSVSIRNPQPTTCVTNTIAATQKKCMYRLFKLAANRNQ